MNKAIKWGLIICASLVVLVIAALLIAPAFIDIRDYKPQLEKKVADATGRPFSVGDDLSLSLFPWAGISFSDLRLGNTSGFSEKALVTVKSFEVRVKLLPLISKDIQVKRFILDEPNITLVKNKNGQVNWAPSEDAKKKSAAEKTGKASKSEEAEAGLPIKDLTVGEFSIKNGSLIWIDHTANTRKEITAVNLKLRDVSLRDVSLERPVTLSFSALLDNQPLSIDGTVGPVGKDPGSKPGIDMAVEIKAFSPRKLMAALDQKFPVATSDPDALGRVALKANLKGDQKKLMVSDGILNLDESTLKFSLTASDFSRPNLALDGRIQIGQLVVNKAKIEDLHLQIKAKNGIFNLDPLKLNMYQGNVSGVGNFNVQCADQYAQKQSKP
jgi:AsmA protein